jgi:hypothetical protein
MTTQTQDKTGTEVATSELGSGMVTFTDKKGKLGSISAEGALFKGGVALAALKDIAVDVALEKAAHGKYRAASDILAVAFPRTVKAFTTLYPNAQPWDNKARFTSFVQACDSAVKPEKGWSKRQDTARLVVAALLRGLA